MQNRIPGDVLVFLVIIANKGRPFDGLAKEPHNCKCCETGLSTSSEKIGMSNRLQMSLQRQHFLLSYLKTLSVGPAGV